MRREGAPGEFWGQVEHLLILSGMFPPMRGGLPDHTDRLAHALSKDFRVTVLTSPGVDTDRPFAVRAEVTNWHDRDGLLHRVRAAAGEGPILWQYVPHMYGRGGVNFAVPGAMEGLAQDGRRQVVLAHEIRAPLSWWPHRGFYALSHRFMWRRVRKAADGIGISTGAWLERERRRGPDAGIVSSSHGTQGAGPLGGKPVVTGVRWFLAPSPSNIPVVRVDAGHCRAWRASHGLEGAAQVMAFFGSVGTGKQFDWVLEGWREARRRSEATGLVVLGGRPDPHLTDEERRWFRALGYLGGEEISQALQTVDLLALPFEDGVSERRSSFMVGLAHGMAVLTTVGEGTGEELRAGDFFRGVPLEAGGRGFAIAAGQGLAEVEMLRAMGERALRRYAERYDWACLAETIGRQLGERRSRVSG